MPEQNLAATAKSIKRQIKIKLYERDMSQIELAELISETAPQVSRAINGDTSPKSVKIREKIYRVLGIED